MDWEEELFKMREEFFSGLDHPEEGEGLDGDGDIGRQRSIESDGEDCGHDDKREVRRSDEDKYLRRAKRVRSDVAFFKEERSDGGFEEDMDGEEREVEDKNEDKEARLEGEFKAYGDELASGSDNQEV